MRLMGHEGNFERWHAGTIFFGVPARVEVKAPKIAGTYSLAHADIHLRFPFAHPLIASTKGCDEARIAVEVFLEAALREPVELKWAPDEMQSDQELVLERTTPIT